MMEQIKADIIDKLTPQEKQNLELYWRVSDEQSELVNEHVARAVMANPEIASYVANIPPDMLQRQREDNRALLRKALKEGDWGPMIESWTSTGTRFAIAAISLESWHQVFSSSREALISALYDAYGQDPKKYQNAIRGMDLYFDIGHLALSKAYINAKEEIIRKEEQQIRAMEKQIVESEKLAVLGRLAAAVAHEVNNPLEAVKNVIHIVMSDVPKEAPNRKLLEIADNETKRLSEIIKQMVNLYRPEPAKVHANVNDVVNSAILLLKSDLQVKGIRLRSDLNQCAPVLVDKGQLEQVLINLFLNARDAMPKGGELRVKTENSRPGENGLLPHPHVVINVGDSGIGISEENMQQLFKPFFSTKQSDNMGIGLWVCQNIINSFGGEIKAQSKPGDGTTFTIALPSGEK